MAKRSYKMHRSAKTSTLKIFLIFNSDLCVDTKTILDKRSSIRLISGSKILKT